MRKEISVYLVFIGIAVMMAAQFALGDPAAPGPVLEAPVSAETLASQPPEVPKMGEGIIGGLKGFLGLAVPDWVFAIGSFALVEIVGRFWKTTKPWSLLYFLRDFCVYFALVLNAISSMLDRLLQRSREKTSNPSKL